jgi:hypothetical protein
LVRAAWAANQAEAEMVQGMLREMGIPSVARRSGGFDVPDFLAAGPRDILVSAGRYADAQEALHGAEPPGPVPSHGPVPAAHPWRVFAGVLVAFALAAAAVVVISALS